MVNACLTENDADSVYGLGDRYRARHRRGGAILIFERLYQDPDSVDNNRKGLGSAYLSAKNWCGCKAGGSGWRADPGRAVFHLYVASLLSAHAAGACRCARGTPTAGVCAGASGTGSPHEATAWDWRETWQQCLETLRRCVYLDKDLVLPPMWESGRPRLSL